MSKNRNIILLSSIILITLVLIHNSGLIDRCLFYKKIERIKEGDWADLGLLFRQLVFENDFGYTLFGEKPISLAGYFIQQPVNNIIFGHSERIPLARLWQTWSKYHHEFEGDNFLVLNEPDPSSEEMRIITLINKKCFIAKVNEHQELFMKELGEEVTGEALLKRVSTGNATLFEVLHKNEQLYGILLGYGKDNAWVFQRRYDLLKALSHYQECTPLNFSLRFPKRSSDFNSLEEEFSYWEQRTGSFAWPCYWSHIRPPSFVALNNTPETLELQKKYRETQRKLVDLYSKQDFLKTTLRQLSL